MLSFILFSFVVSVFSQLPSCTPPPYADLCIFPANYCIRVYSNINVSSTTDRVTATKAIIVVHGAARDADSYYCAIQVASQLEGYNLFNKDIIIISPLFMEHSDSPKATELYWNDGWKTGSNSLVPSNANDRVASFGVVDKIVALLTIDRAALYPNLVNITVTGHSAGGQFMQRYAVTSPITDIVDVNKYRMKFVPSNPSSFCYLDTRRWFNDETFRELTASEKAACPNYNSWIYGFTLD